MSLELRELTPALLDDYLAFFDRDAFADFPWWSACYCTFYRDPQHDGNSTPAMRDLRRARAEAFVASGEQQGLLAYDGGTVVGWCNADVRSRYAALRRFADIVDGPGDRIGATMCFVVAAPHRGKGVASALLDAAGERFRRLGLELAEGYPTTSAPTGPYADQIPSTAHNYHGPLAMYLKAGYTIDKQLDQFAVVRKPLR